MEIVGGVFHRIVVTLLLLTAYLCCRFDVFCLQPHLLHGHSYGLHYASCLFVCPALCLCHKQSGIDEP